MLFPAPKPEPRAKRPRARLARGKWANPPATKRRQERSRVRFQRAYLSVEYVLNIRSKPCEAPGCKRRDIHCAHVGRTRKNGGMWYEVAPLCSRHHAEQEGRTARFNAKHDTDLLARAAAHAMEWRAFSR